MTNFKSVCVLALVVLFFAFSCGCRNNQDISSQIEVTSDELIGIWKLDSVTKYTFDGRGNGKMAVSDSEYEFNYTINNDEIKIDFVSESAQDSTYEFIIDENKLTLLSKDKNKGTFELTKEN
nr:DUF5640 domain-containing protein [Ruminococcus intestinalis]